jgi:phasin family protein
VYISTNEHLGWAQSDSVDAAFSLTQQVFQCFEKLVELNQQAVKATVAESGQAWQSAMSGKTPVELWVQQANAVRPVAERALSYNRQVLEIATHTQVEFLKFFKARFEHHNAKLQELVDGVARHAPAGSEAAVTVMKSTVSSANLAYNTVLKATEQAIAMAQRSQPAAIVPASGSAKSRDHARAD